jgi:hypothetical protein
MCVYSVLTLARVILSFGPFGFAVLCKYTVIHVVLTAVNEAVGVGFMLGFGFQVLAGVGFMLGFGFQAWLLLWLLGLKPMGFGFRPPPVKPMKGAKTMLMLGLARKSTLLDDAARDACAHQGRRVLRSLPDAMM